MVYQKFKNVTTIFCTFSQKLITLLLPLLFINRLTHVKGKKDSNIVSIFSTIKMAFYHFVVNVLIILFAYSVFLRISNYEFKASKKVIISVVYTIFTIAISLIISSIHVGPIKSIFMLLFSSAFLASLYKKNIIKIFFYVIVSYGVSLLMYLISITVSTIILTIPFKIDDVDIKILFLAIIFELIFIIIIYKVKFKIMLENKKGLGGAGIALLGISLIIYTILREGGFSDRAFVLLVISGVLCAFGLFCWVKRESLAAYNEKFHLKINSKLRAENEQLNEVRLYLEKIVHNDSKKLPVYQGVVESLVENTENPAMREKALRVLAQIKDTRKEYFERISKELREKKVLLTTGLEFLDAVFKHYQKICAVKDIDFDLIIRGTPSIIKQVELETLVVNLLENAIIACEHNSQVYKSIVVNLSDGGISVIDNGIAFERETLELLGKQQVTTHADSGGSGLGFLTISEIAQACKASIVITETENYKTVSVRFDGKDEYRVEDEETLRV